MANRIYLLCRSPKQISYGEIVEQMGHMGFLDELARFEPPLDGSNTTKTDWGAFELHYRGSTTPITVEQFATSAEREAIIGEIREKLDDEPVSPVRVLLSQQLECTVHGLVFDLPDELPEDVWEMLDATEGYFAGVCEGLIVAHEGIFDSNLQLVLRWSTPGI